MSTKTETFHREGFLVSEANGTLSRDKVTVISGENLKAGQVVAQLTTAGKKWQAWDSAKSDEHDGSSTAKGIVCDDCDATGGDVKGVVIIARDAEVNLNELVWPSGAQQSEKDKAIASLALLNIIAR